MDQVKEYLQIAIKYRFWIVVGIAALMPVIGYFSAAGSIEAATQAATSKIESAYKGVDPYKVGAVVNAQYKPLVDTKTKVLQSDVNAAWQKLYDRQAPLLTWPESVADRFQGWGPKWPENTDPTLVKQAVIDYVETYHPYADAVYRTLNPFDYETGEGIVVAPPQEALLMYPEFNINDLPEYGKVWNTQRRFWVQHTVLDVLAKVNERAGATDWTSAPVKQILDLQVANELAQDQRSVGKGDKLADAPKIAAPGSESAAPAADASGGMSSGGMMSSGSGADSSGGEGPDTSGYESMMQSAMGSGAGMMGSGAGMMGSGGMGMGMGMNAAKAAKVFKLLPVPNADQVYVVPVYLSVYVEQDRIPDLIVEFSNSPMDIQIIEFSMIKPEPGAVEKPEKGDTPPGMAGGMRGMMGEMMGYGGMMSGDMMSSEYTSSMMMQMQQMQQMSSASGMDPSMMMDSRMGGSGSTKERKGKDVRAQSLEALKSRGEAPSEDDENAARKKKAAKPKNIDRYYNVVRVELYGQARFFFPPPRPETLEPSQSVASEQPIPADGSAPPADGSAPAADTAAAAIPDGSLPPLEDAAAPGAAPGTGVTPAPAPPEPGTESAQPQPEAAETDTPAPAPADAMPADAPQPGADAPEPRAEANAPAQPETNKPQAEPTPEPAPAPEPTPAPDPAPGAEPRADAGAGAAPPQS